MNNRSGKSGFTLVEILIAIVIIAAIVSIVYGSYFAASKSAQACKRRMAKSQEGRELLGQMAQQIRCCYDGSVKKSIPAASKGALKNEETPKNVINYFAGKSGEMSGKILYLVTSNGIFEEQAPGLFEVTYKFDKNTGTLFLNQDRFVDGSKSFKENRNWQLLAENIESIELEFSDGRDWLPAWDFKEKRTLPYAVKINITCLDENHQQYAFGTTAYICSRKNQDIKTTSETFLSINKQ